MNQYIPTPALPTITGTTFVSAETLRNVGTDGFKYGLKLGEVVEFPRQLTGQSVISVPVKDSQMFLVAVLRDGQAGWFAISQLRVKDAAGNHVNTIGKALANCADDFERLQAVLGRTIKGTRRINYQAKVFKDGQPVDGVVKERSVIDAVFIDGAQQPVQQQTVQQVAQQYQAPQPAYQSTPRPAYQQPQQQPARQQGVMPTPDLPF
jgi:hypothetical protein